MILEITEGASVANVLSILSRNKSSVVMLTVAAAANWYWWTILQQQTPSGRQRRSDAAIIGTTAAPIVAKSPVGAWERLQFGAASPDTILYAISPTCVWCERNTANVQALAKGLAGQYRVIGLFLGSQGDPKAYADSHSLSFPLYSELSEQSMMAYRLGGTPQTIVVKRGQIVANWVGAYTGPQVFEVEQFFSLKLPGLLEDGAVGTTARQATTCTVPDGGLYSPGAIRNADGKSMRCDAKGTWQPVTDR